LNQRNETELETAKEVAIARAFLVALASGLIALAALTWLGLEMAEWPITPMLKTLLSATGRWLLPLYIVAIIVPCVGIPLGAAAGLLLGQSSPHWMVISFFVVVTPYALASSDPSVYFPSLCLGGSIWSMAVAIQNMHRSTRVRPISNSSN
jgi:hypothetical protein